MCFGVFRGLFVINMFVLGLFIFLFRGGYSVSHFCFRGSIGHLTLQAFAGSFVSVLLLLWFSISRFCFLSLFSNLALTTCLISLLN